jgi:hypothetical protein
MNHCRKFCGVVFPAQLVVSLWIFVVTSFVLQSLSRHRGETNKGFGCSFDVHTAAAVNQVVQNLQRVVALP